MFSKAQHQTTTQRTTESRRAKEVFLLALSCEDLDVLIQAMAMVNSPQNEPAKAHLDEIIYLDSPAPIPLQPGPFAMPAAA